MLLKFIKNRFFLNSILLVLISCNGNKTSDKLPLAEINSISDTLSSKTQDELLTENVIGIWNTVEEVRVETIMFSEDGIYKGYDGQSFEGTWEIKDQKINLSYSGEYAIRITKDTMYLDSTRFLRQLPEITDNL